MYIEKNISIYWLLKYLIVLILIFAFNSASAQKPVLKAAVPTGNVQSIKLQNKEDSLQYILGSFIGLWINNNGFAITNSNLFSKGLDDILQNRPRTIPDSAIAPLIAFYQQANQKTIAFKQEQLMFATIKDKPGIGMFPNGVRYSILNTGKGRRPSETDSIVLHLIAKLPDGTVVEDTYQSKKPFNATTSSFFPGLNDALQNMPQGSKWQLFIPSALAYAEKGTSLIPPYSALILEVELLEVRIK